MISRRHFIQLTGWSTSSLLLTGLWVSANEAATGWEFTIANPTDIHFREVPVRLRGIDETAGRYLRMMVGNREIPWQGEHMHGEYLVWVAVTVAPGSSVTIKVVKGKSTAGKKGVTIQRHGEYYLLQNGYCSIRLPASLEQARKGPLGAVRLNNGHWVGSSKWKTESPLTAYHATVVGDGTVYAKLRMRFEFGVSTQHSRSDIPYSEIEVSLAPGWKHIGVGEKHAMGRGDCWEWVMSTGWSPNSGISKPFDKGPGGDSGYIVPPADRLLLPVNHVSYAPGLYINLVPRWNQHFKDGWAFAASDGIDTLCSVAVGASQWRWPHDNSLQAMVNHTGNYAALTCSTFHGARWWWLSIYPEVMETEYIRQHCWENLDKINSDYILDWPGRELKWWSTNPYNGNETNPTGKVRAIGAKAVANAGKISDPTDLVRFQTLLHRDVYGSYWDRFSPENPNFFTDYHLVPIALAANLRDHPRFEILRQLAEAKFREDLYHSVTLPGGAGQETAWYMHFALSRWKEIAEIGKNYLGFDMPFINERMQAAEAFYERMSFPDGTIRRCSPVGDSHPEREKNTGMAVVEVDAAIVQNWTTEEYPGFGVLFSNHAGSSRETYFSFKSGPNRCHYHGDQLSFHYCANARPVVVDHHCSYRPRAGQEHMHNRLAFFTDGMPFANMDGYERVIAFKTASGADIAIGQVESNRLRQVNALPPETWDARYPVMVFEQPLVYRRTVVLMKGAGQDYFVLRDQFRADRKIGVAFCLHTYGHSPVKKGNQFDFGNLQLFTTLTDYSWQPFDWSHENGGKEETRGIRVEILQQEADIITVLYPGKTAPDMRPIPGGVQVGDDTIVFGGGLDAAPETNIVVDIQRAERPLLTLCGSEINLHRFQGDVGLFIPDSGYPFGEIPDWLLQQRASIPSWAKHK